MSASFQRPKARKASPSPQISEADVDKILALVASREAAGQVLVEAVTAMRRTMREALTALDQSLANAVLLAEAGEPAAAALIATQARGIVRSIIAGMEAVPL